eukprot:1157916-Pelagomonas_calceolata.AAC.9
MPSVLHNLLVPIQMRQLPLFDGRQNTGAQHLKFIICIRGELAAGAEQRARQRILSYSHNAGHDGAGLGFG